MKPVDPSKQWLLGRTWDGLFLIHAPILAIALGMLGILAPGSVDFNGLGIPYKNTFYHFFISSFTYAHIVLIYVRTHLNRAIFDLYPVRFVGVPLLLLGLFAWSPHLAVIGACVGAMWDVYHSAQQTFGLGRIYDARAGNDPTVGRRADYWMSLLIYVGPILGGAVLIDHCEMLAPLGKVGYLFFGRVPVLGATWSATLTRIVVAVALPSILLYLLYYWRLADRGYRISSPKVALVASTALCSIFAWGFNPFGTAFFIMNFFHALQYFAIVWFAERGTILRCLGMERGPRGAGLALYVMLACALGVCCELGARTSDSIYAVVLMSSLMHFWADGFVWSVRKSQV